MVRKLLKAGVDAKQQKTDRGSSHTSRSSALRESILAELDDRQVVERFAKHSTNADVLDILRPGLTALVATIISGALIPGRGGYNDRMTLFRMLGLPWTPNASVQGKSNNQIDALADRFVRAVSRAEARLSGRLPVTQDAELVLEATPEPPETV
jgi:hypothetical protein